MNIYIKAMEIGNRSTKGVLYKNLKAMIENDLKFEFDRELELVFIEWLLNNFKCTTLNGASFVNVLHRLKQYFSGNIGDAKENQITYEQFEVRTFYLKGETMKQYLDYLELKESREQAKRAFYFSIGSIALAIVSIIFTWYISSHEPKPPYEVKVIENQVNHTKLTNEIDSLRNELGKASMMIDIYEEDALNERDKPK